MMGRLLIIFLLLVPILAKAEWVKIVKTADSTSTTGSEFSIDPSSIIKDQGYSRIWILQNFNANQISEVNNKIYTSAKMYWEVDCSKRRFRALSIAYYSKKNSDGSIVESYTYDPPTSWAYIGPGEISSFVAKYTCH